MFTILARSLLLHPNRTSLQGASEPCVITWQDAPKALSGVCGESIPDVPTQQCRCGSAEVQWLHVTLRVADVAQKILVWLPYPYSVTPSTSSPHCMRLVLSLHMIPLNKKPGARTHYD
jgi:hypothetical protein